MRSRSRGGEHGLLQPGLCASGLHFHLKSVSVNTHSFEHFPKRHLKAREQYWFFMALMRMLNKVTDSFNCL